ncbi:MAG: hypothetical protein KA792_06880 [Bacteroidales bacterium]|nr:hypothetical protein [Bacteroidales bacterium]
MRSLLILLLIASFLQSPCQEDNKQSIQHSKRTLTYSYVDSLSYQQFLDEDYNEVIKTCRQALKAGIDFYYLRTRLSIAYYESRKYASALKHFLYAYKMNPSDLVLKEYLYYSLIFSLRRDAAYILAETFPESLKDKLNQNTKYPLPNTRSSAKFEAISFSGGYIFSDNSKKSDKNRSFAGDALYAENTLQGNTSFADLYLKNSFGNRLKMYNNIGFFNVRSFGLIQHSKDTLTRNYSNNNINYTLGFDYNLLNIFPLRRSVSATHYPLPATIRHFSLDCGLWFMLLSERSNYFSSMFNDSAYTYFNNPHKYKAKAAGLSFIVRYLKAGLGFSIAVGSLSAVKQKQAQLDLSFYPFGNTGFYSNSGIALIDNDNKIQTVILQSFSGKINNIMRYEIKGSFGNHQNYIVQDAIFAYNTVEPVYITAEANLSIRFNNFTFIPGYSYQQRESKYIKFNQTKEIITIKNKYNNHLIKFTVLWNI